MARPRTPPPEQQSTEQPPTSGHPGAVTAVAVGVSAPPEPGHVAGLLPPVIGVKAVQEAVEAIVKAYIAAAVLRAGRMRGFLGGLLRIEHPELSNDEIDRLVTEEMLREKEFRAKMEERLRKDIAAAVGIPDPAERAARLQAIQRRENRYVSMREQAMAERANAAVDRMELKKESRQGAYWTLDPSVKQHTPGCLALSGKVWPWSVLDLIHPPLHPGCPCKLMGVKDAQERGWLPTPFEMPDEKDAMKQAEDAIALEEACLRHLTGEQLQEAYDRRFPKGTKEGGRFMPKRGGVTHPVIHLLHELLPHVGQTPRERQRGRAHREVTIKGLRVRVPEQRRFDRVIGGEHFTSPPGSTNVYRNGTLVSTPRSPEAHPDLAPGKPSTGTTTIALGPHSAETGLPGSIAGLAVGMQAEYRMIEDRVRTATGHRARGDLPIEAGDPGYLAHEALMSNGFVVSNADEYADKQNVEYVHEQTGSMLTLSYDLTDPHERVGDVLWTPRTLPAETTERTSPPETGMELLDDTRAFMHRLAGEQHDRLQHFGREPFLSTMSYTQEMADHEGSHDWGGRMLIAAEVQHAIEEAHMIRSEMKVPLDDAAKWAVFASYKTTTHEALHAVAPVRADEYQHPTDRALEEALTEELALRYAMDRLVRSGQRDVAQWAVDHPTDFAVTGAYPFRRAYLGVLLDRMGLAPEERQTYLEDLKFRYTPPERVARIRADLLAHGGFEGELEADNFMEGWLATYEGQRSPPDVNVPTVSPFHPDIAPSPAPEVGRRVTFHDRHGKLVEGEVTLTATLNGITLLDVRTEHGVVMGVAPSEIVSSVEQPLVAHVGEHEVRPGDTVSYDGIADGSRSEAVVTRIIRPSAAGKDDYVVEVRTTERSKRPGEYVWLTSARSGGSISVVQSAPEKLPEVAVPVKASPGTGPSFDERLDTLLPGEQLSSSGGVIRRDQHDPERFLVFTQEHQVPPVVMDREAARRWMRALNKAEDRRRERREQGVILRNKFGEDAYHEFMSRQEKPSPGTLREPRVHPLPKLVQGATDGANLGTLFDTDPDAPARIADDFGHDSVTGRQVRAARDKVYAETQAALRERGLPETFTVWRVGSVKPGEVQSFGLTPHRTFERTRGQRAVPYTVRREDVLVDTNAFIRHGYVGENEVMIRGDKVRPVVQRSPGTALAWAKMIPPGHHLPVYHAEGEQGRYVIDRGTKLWHVSVGGDPERWSGSKGVKVGAAKSLARAKLLAAESDSGRWLQDRRLMVEGFAATGTGAWKEGPNLYELWGGDPARMPEGQYAAARAGLLSLHDGLPDESKADKLIRQMLAAMISRGGQERMKAQVGKRSPGTSDEVVFPELPDVRHLLADSTLAQQWEPMLAYLRDLNAEGVPWRSERGGEGLRQWLGQSPEPIWRTPRKEYDIPQPPNLTEMSTDDASAYFAAIRKRRNEWDAAMRRALSLGQVQYVEAEKLGYHDIGHESRESVKVNGRDAGGWQKMPDDLYHVTTARRAVEQHGLLTREELRQGRGVGLGGGSEDTVSFTTNPELAQHIEQGLREMRAVARGEVTVQDLLDRAARGDEGSRPFLTQMIRSMHNVPDWKPGDPYPRGTQDVLDGVKRGNYGLLLSPEDAKKELGPTFVPDPNAEGLLTPKRGRLYAGPDFVRPMTEQEKIAAAVDYFKGWLAYREHAGGPADPLFFSSDPQALARVPEQDIATLRFRPRSGAQGYPMSGMNEWRTGSGRAVELVPDAKASPGTTGDGYVPPAVEPVSVEHSRPVSAVEQAKALLAEGAPLDPNAEAERRRQSLYSPEQVATIIRAYAYQSKSQEWSDGIDSRIDISAGKPSPYKDQLIPVTYDTTSGKPFGRTYKPDDWQVRGAVWSQDPVRVVRWDGVSRVGRIEKVEGDTATIYFSPSRMPPPALPRAMGMRVRAMGTRVREKGGERTGVLVEHTGRIQNDRGYTLFTVRWDDGEVQNDLTGNDLSTLPITAPAERQQVPISEIAALMPQQPDSYGAPYPVAPEDVPAEPRPELVINSGGTRWGDDSQKMALALSRFSIPTGLEAAWREHMDHTDEQLHRYVTELMGGGGTYSPQAWRDGIPEDMQGAWVRAEYALPPDEQGDVSGTLTEVTLLEPSVGNGLQSVRTMPVDEFIAATRPYWEKMRSESKARSTVVRASSPVTGYTMEDMDAGPTGLYAQHMERMIEVGRRLDEELRARAEPDIFDERARLRVLQQDERVLREHADDARAGLLDDTEDKVKRLLWASGVKIPHEVPPRPGSKPVMNPEIRMLLGGGLIHFGATGQSRYGVVKRHTEWNDWLERRLPDASYTEVSRIRNDIHDLIDVQNEGPLATAYDQAERQVAAVRAEIKGMDGGGRRIMRGHVLDLLSEIRPMGQGEKPLRYSRTTKKKAREVMEQASVWFPTDWLDLMADDKAPLYVSETKRRGHFDKNAYIDMQGVRRIRVSPSASAVSGDPRGYPVAIHELGHYAEFVNRRIGAMEWAFWHKRRRESEREQRATKSLRSLTGNKGYNSDEYAMPDKFADPYAGKVYHGRDGEYGWSWEVLTMGIEDLVTGRHRMVENNDEYRQWLLGVLATV